MISWTVVQFAVVSFYALVNRNTKAVQKQNLAFRFATTAFNFLIFRTNFEKNKTKYCT